MANTVQLSEILYCKETLATDGHTNSSVDLIHDIPSYPNTYNASDTPGLTIWSQTVTLSGGALTLDLTALTRTGMSTVNMTGKRILAVKIAALSTNTQPVSMVPGASNPYSALGLGVSVGVSATAGERPDEVLIHKPSASAVDGTHKNLDLASAMSAASVAIIIVART